MDRYSYARSRVAAKLAEFSIGTVTLTRSTFAAPAAETPWKPGDATTTTYTLDARVDGVTGDYVDGVTIVATDLVVIASPTVVPLMTDTLAIDGAVKAIKRIEPVPASGDAALFRIYIAS